MSRRPELRPLGVGQILDIGINLFGNHFWTLVRIVLFIVAPVQIVSSIIAVSVTPEEDRGGFFDSGTVDSDDVGTYVAGTLAITILGFLAGMVATGACFRALAQGYLGDTPTVRESLSFAARRLHSILWVTLLAGLLSVLGLILCVIPGIYLWVGFSVAVPVLLTEGLRGRHALGRSRSLVSGRWWGAFAIVLLGGLITAIGGGIIEGVLFGIGSIDTAHTEIRDFVIGALSGTLSSSLTTPLMAAFTTVLYFDLRVRKEAFDLQILAENLGLEAPPLVPGQSPAPLAPPTASAGIEQIQVECPRCSHRYQDWFRPGAEADGQLTDEYHQRATTATCPSCGHVIAVKDLEPGADGVWRARSS